MFRPCSMSRSARRCAPIVVAGALLVAACGGSSESSQAGGGRAGNPEANELQAIVASFDLTVGPPRRFLLGLATGDRRLIGFGAIDVRFHPPEGTDAGRDSAPQRATF